MLVEETDVKDASTRAWVYPLSVKGRFQRLHRWSGLALQAVLFVVPWLSLHGAPLVRIDIPARRLYAFGSIFTAQDTVFLVLMGLFAAFSLFFFTSLFGRLWCGFACPQTVFLEEWIRPIERFIEGERGVRMARDKGAWSAEKIARKAAKFTAFAGVAGLVAMVVVSWFAGAHALWTGAAGMGAYGMVGIFSAVLFLDFAWFREQFCNYVCPYARFQGALSDDESLIVSYNAGRGEPRRAPGTKAVLGAGTLLSSSLAFGGEAAGTGACIDCKKCVAVCPQGIDIREGFQLECIACARCIDACEPIMAKNGQVSLIGYTSLSKSRWIRPRTVAYGGLLSAVGAAFLALLAGRSEVQATMNRAPGPLYVVDADGWVRNTYLLRLTNNSAKAEHYTFSLGGLPADAEAALPPVDLATDASVVLPVIVRLPAGDVSSRTLALSLTIDAQEGGDSISLATTFKTPGTDGT
jgi:cytochrome c oxidase accessory protein FixG